MVLQRVPPKKQKRWDDRPAFKKLIATLEFALRSHDLLSAGSLLILIVTTPWLVLGMILLAAAGFLTSLAIRFTNRQDSLLILKAGHL